MKAKNIKNEVCVKTICIDTFAQAIEKGVLVNVTQAAEEAGFPVPMVMTHAVWDTCIESRDTHENREDHKPIMRTEDFLWGFMWTLRLSFKDLKNNFVAYFTELGTQRHPKTGKQKPIPLKATLARGDRGEWHIRVMLASEEIVKMNS